MTPQEFYDTLGEEFDPSLYDPKKQQFGVSADQTMKFAERYYEQEISKISNQELLNGFVQFLKSTRGDIMELANSEIMESTADFLKTTNNRIK